MGKVRRERRWRRPGAGGHSADRSVLAAPKRGPIVLVPRPRPRNRLSFPSEPLRQARTMKSRGRGRGTRTRTMKEGRAGPAIAGRRSPASGTAPPSLLSILIRVRHVAGVSPERHSSPARDAPKGAEAAASAVLGGGGRLRSKTGQATNGGGGEGAKPLPTPRWGDGANLLGQRGAVHAFFWSRDTSAAKCKHSQVTLMAIPPCCRSPVALISESPITWGCGGF